jgi:predicted ribosome quality control (RQC) complex YloA/Tae2 family protein
MSDEHESTSDKSPDLKARLKQFTQPLMDSLDSKIRDQVDHRVDERVEQSLSARLSVIERAIADLDREVKELQKKATN